MAKRVELVVTGPRPLRGRLRVPGDKGISHRALVLAALADGRTRITGLAPGDDVARTRAALERLGAVIGGDGAGATVQGVAGRLVEPDGVIDCGNSGTTMRLLLGVLAASDLHAVLTGDASLATRPMGRVVEPLRALGARIDGRADGTLAPLAVRGGALQGTRCVLEVASAQAKSALLLAGLRAEGTTEVVEPAPSRDHTERMLASLGAPIERVDDRTVRVRRCNLPPFDLEVPGDPSSAAFFVVAAAVTPGSRAVLEGVDLNPTRIGFVDVLRRMGARVDVRPHAERMGEPVGDLEVEAGALHSTTIEGDEVPLVQDEVPALAVAAAFADGITEIRDAAELRVKESDRIGALEQELTQLGIEVEARPDGLRIAGGRPRPGLLKSHGDHRIAMAAAIAANACGGESAVRGWDAVAVSYPGFAADLQALTDGAAP